MTVRLLVRQRSEAGGREKPTEILLNDERITIGRDPACQVCLPEKAVSRSHARIIRDGALFFIEDLGSAYGTSVNGQKVPKGEKRLLRVGDVVAIAQYDVTFDKVAEVSKPPEGQPDNPAFEARQAIKGALKGVGDSVQKPYFRVMNGPREGEHITLQDAQELVVGRDESADLIFKDDLVSRRHARIRRDWSGTHVEDLESRNGIRVNRRRVNQRTLKNQDEVEIGAVRLLYLDPNAPPESKGPIPEDLEDTRLPAHREDLEPEPEPEPPMNPVLSDPPPPPSAKPAPLPPEPSGESGSSFDDSNMSGFSEDSEGAPPPPANFVEALMRDPKRAALIAGMVIFALLAVGIFVLILFGL